MTPYKHQTEISKLAYKILQEHYLVYLAMEERTGKTLISLLVAEMSKAINILVITKKKILKDWNKTLIEANNLLTKNYTVTNYHQVNKFSYSVAAFDLIIVDEAHNYISSFPKTGTLYKDVAIMCRNKPLIFLSATPYAQSYSMLYHQLKLSTWSPFRQFRNFYDWHRFYGISDLTRTPYGLKETYKKTKDEVTTDTKHLFVVYTRKELGFEFEPIDELHYITLDKSTKLAYNNAMTERFIMVEDEFIPLDTPMKLRVSLHMLEGGVAKLNDKYFVLPNEEKIDYIKANFSDDFVLMYNYKAEYDKLSKHFSADRLLQATSFAEGISLVHIKHLIIYSQDFSTARHTQRRARQANKQRKEPIIVHFLLVKNAISDKVYKTVSVNKKNFVDTVFDRI